MSLAESRERLDAVVGPPSGGQHSSPGRQGESLMASPPTWRALEALVEKYRGRRFEELLRDPGFRRLSPMGVRALAADYRRQTKRLRSDIEEARSIEAAGSSGSSDGLPALELSARRVDGASFPVAEDCD